MNSSEAFEIAQAVLVSLGGGALLVLALSSWLGKVWANRMMEKERAKYESDLEKIKANLSEKLEKNNLNYRQKIDLYKEISTPIIQLVVSIEHQGNFTQEQMKAFEIKRLEITAQLAMFAPQSVFNKYNGFIDYIYNCFEGKDTYTFNKFRVLALEFLSEIRNDIGIYSDSVSYSGDR